MKHMLTALVIAGLSAPILAQSPGGGGAASPVAYVSVQRIISESTDAKAAAARLEKMKQEKTREVAEKQKELDATHQQLMQSGGVFQASKRAQLQADEERQKGELQRVTQQAQTDLQSLQRDIQNELKTQLGTIIDEIAKRRRLQVVLNQDTTLLWAASGLDLTAEVLEKMNAGVGRAKAPAK